MIFEVVRIRERAQAIQLANELRAYLLGGSKHPYFLLWVYRTALFAILTKRLICQRSPERWIIWRGMGLLLPYVQPLCRWLRPARSMMMFSEVMVKIERLDVDVWARNRIGSDVYENLSRYTAEYLEQFFCPPLSKTDAIALLKGWDQGEDRPWQTTAEVLECIDDRAG